jgi:hypothetical protein
MSRFTRIFLLAAGLGGAACAAPAAGSVHDPSCPEAAESPLPPRSTTLDRDPHPPDPALAPAMDHAAMGHPRPRAGAAGGGEVDAGPGQARYVCPMHPDVVSDAPGTCPRCHMALVLRTEGAP